MLLVSMLLLFSVLYPAETEQCMAPDNQQMSILKYIKKELRDRSLNQNPEAFIALRLGIDHDLQMEQTILRSLSESAVRKVQTGELFPIDQMAFYILAFRSSCWNATNISTGNKEVNLLAKLRESLYREIHEVSTMPYSNENTGHVLKTFTEVSLAILALCLEKEYVHSFIIHYFARIHLRKIAQHGGEFTVDSMAIAALSLTCLIHSQHARGRTRLEIAKALMRIIKWILSKVREDGTIGSLSSTGLAMQALRVNINVYTSRIYNCRKSVQKMVQEFSQGNIENLRSVSQVAIALGGKSYLDVNKIVCSPYKAPTMTTMHSEANKMPTGPGSQTPLYTHSSILSKHIKQVPTSMSSPATAVSSIQSMSMETYFPLVRKRLTPSSAGKILNPTPSLMTENVSTMLGSWTTETLRKVKSAKNNEGMLTHVPIVTSGIADTVKSSIVPMGTYQAASARHSEPVPILAHGTAPVMTNEAVLSVTRVTSPIVTSGALPVITSGTAKSTNAIAPAMTTETAQIVNTMAFGTSEATFITSTGVQDGITRDGISIMASEPAFNDTSKPVPINSNETAYVTPRETDIVSSETGHRNQ